MLVTLGNGIAYSYTYEMHKRIIMTSTKKKIVDVYMKLNEQYGQKSIIKGLN